MRTASRLCPQPKTTTKEGPDSRALDGLHDTPQMERKQVGGRKAADKGDQAGPGGEREQLANQRAAHRLCALRVPIRPPGLQSSSVHARPPHYPSSIRGHVRILSASAVSSMPESIANPPIIHMNGTTAA